MHFTNVTAKGFRGFSEMEVAEFGRINCILGKNNAGKTSILEALFLLSGVSNHNLLFSLMRMRKGVDPKPSQIRTLFKQTPPTNEFILGARTTTGVTRELSLKVGLPGDEVTVDSINARYETGGGLSEDELFYSLVCRFSDGYKAKGESRLEFSPAESTWKFKPINIAEKYISLYYLSPYSIHSDMGKLLDYCVRSKTMPMIVDALNKIDPSIRNIELGGGDTVYVDMGTVPMLPIELMGEGIRRITVLLATMLNYQNGVVLVDEIENGLYYSTHSIMWEAVNAVAMSNNVQVIATTHSQECMTALAKSTAAEQARFIRLEHSSKGELRTVAMESDAIVAIEEIGAEVR